LQICIRLLWSIEIKDNWQYRGGRIKDANTYSGERSGALEKIRNVLVPLPNYWCRGNRSGNGNSVLLKLSGCVGVVRESLFGVP